LRVHLRLAILAITHVRALADELRLALELADEADRISLGYFQSARLTVETKPDRTPVTQADREVELAIRHRVALERPDHEVLGEEFGGDAAAASARWIVDPIDGTKRFMRGVPLFATLLALELDGELVVGVASAPALGRRWWAARGLGAFANGRTIHVSGVQRLDDAHVSHASLESWLASGMLEQLEAIGRRTWSTSGYGDFWTHLLVAEGAADAALEPTAAIWDLAALKVIVEEAGGRFTDFAGQPTAAGPTGLSSNGGPIHDELLGLLGRHA
jgi:histidinol-phosphatase